MFARVSLVPHSSFESCAKKQPASTRTATRDIFDCAVAARADRAALGVAVNALDPQTLHELRARTAAGAEAYRRNAPEEMAPA